MPINVEQFYNNTNNHSDSDFYPRARKTHNNDKLEEKPCRACTDFKIWFKNQTVGDLQF